MAPQAPESTFAACIKSYTSVDCGSTQAAARHRPRDVGPLRLTHLSPIASTVHLNAKQLHGGLRPTSHCGHRVQHFRCSPGTLSSSNSAASVSIKKHPNITALHLGKSTLTILGLPSVIWRDLACVALDRLIRLDCIIR